jgi:hypothetical protein
MAETKQYNHETFAFDVRCRPGEPGEPEVRHTLLADHAGARALRQLFAALAADSCRYPITPALEISGAALNMLLDHGVPPRELHAEIDRIETNRRSRERPAEFLPPPLLGVYNHLLATADRFIRAHVTGEPWGITGPIVIVGRRPHSCEHYLAIDPVNPDALVIERDPEWAGGRELRLVGPDLGDKVIRLLAESDAERGDDWGADLERWAAEARRKAGVPPWGETEARSEAEAEDGRSEDDDTERSEEEETERSGVIPPYHWHRCRFETDNTEVLDFAAEVLPPPLLSLLHNIAEAPRPMPSVTTVHETGAQYGYDWPIVHVRGGMLNEFHYYLSIAPYAPDVLTIGRDPIWPGHMVDITVPLSDPALVGKTRVPPRLLRKYPLRAPAPVPPF